MSYRLGTCRYNTIVNTNHVSQLSILLSRHKRRRLSKTTTPCPAVEWRTHALLELWMRYQRTCRYNTIVNTNHVSQLLIILPLTSYTLYQHHHTLYTCKFLRQALRWRSTSPLTLYTLYPHQPAEFFTIGIEMQLHISPKIPFIKILREIKYDDSQSASKTDKQGKENRSCVYQLIRRVMDHINIQNFTANIDIELNISPKISCIKSLREVGYDDSQSTSKPDKQRKGNRSCVYQLIRRIMDSSKCPSFVKDGQSGNNDFNEWAFGEYSLVPTQHTLLIYIYMQSFTTGIDMEITSPFTLYTLYPHQHAEFYDKYGYRASYLS